MGKNGSSTMRKIIYSKELCFDSFFINRSRCRKNGGKYSCGELIILMKEKVYLPTLLYLVYFFFARFFLHRLSFVLQHESEFTLVYYCDTFLEGFRNFSPIRNFYLRRWNFFPILSRFWKMTSGNFFSNFEWILINEKKMTSESLPYKNMLRVVIK